MKRSRQMCLVVLGALLLLSLAQCTPAPTASPPPAAERVPIRWFVGLEIGSNFTQLEALQAVVADFNASQQAIELRLEVASIAGAYDLFATQISSGTGPDIVGPVSWGVASGFPEQWLDLAPYLAASDFDTSVFDPALLAFYRTPDGKTLSLPFSVSPAALYFLPAMFDEAGLAYPPQVYGEPYALEGRLLPWNWETLTEVAKRLTVDANNHNALQPQFDRSQMRQAGFHPQGQSLVSFGTLWGAARMYASDSQGHFSSTIPDEWKTAWRWWQAGVWGEQPYMAPPQLAETEAFGGGNVFYAGKAAMGLGQASDLCCLADLGELRLGFQLGVLPADSQGRVNGRINESSFYIWQGSAHPEQAFSVLTYLLSRASARLLPAYDAMPAASDQLDGYFARKAAQYPGVTPASWQVLAQGLAYPDIPSANQYLPQRNEAIYRLQIFGDQLLSTQMADFDASFQQLQDDLTAIYNK